MASDIEVAETSAHSSQTEVAPQEDARNPAPASNEKEEDRPSSYHTVSQSGDVRNSTDLINNGAGDRPSIPHLIAADEKPISHNPSNDKEKEDGHPTISPVPEEEEEEDETRYPNKPTVALVMMALYLSGLLVALVRLLFP